MAYDIPAGLAYPLEVCGGVEGEVEGAARTSV